jgi:hypothetical protein
MTHRNWETGEWVDDDPPQVFTAAPGPYAVHEYKSDQPMKYRTGDNPMKWYYITDGEGYVINVDFDNPATAQLLAAAPEMLAALEDIAARNEIQHWFNLDKARAAIKQAKGE